MRNIKTRMLVIIFIILFLIFSFIIIFNIIYNGLCQTNEEDKLFLATRIIILTLAFMFSIILILFLILEIIFYCIAYIIGDLDFFGNNFHNLIIKNILNKFDQYFYEIDDIRKNNG